MITYITDEQIKVAKREGRFKASPDECNYTGVRIAHEWLDAQRIIKNPTGKYRGIKHNIEKLAGFYISISDIEVAENLHPEIHGTYSFFDIHGDFVLPADYRLMGLEGIGKRPRVREFEAYVTFEKPDSLTKDACVKRRSYRCGMTLEQVRRSQQRYKRQ